MSYELAAKAINQFDLDWDIEDLANTLRKLGNGWVDHSNRNDVCPVYLNSKLQQKLWIDFKSPAKRDCSNSKLYALEKVDASGESLMRPMLYEGDKFDTVLDASAEDAVITKVVAS